MEQKESFVVSARKYRPASWDQVVGQEAITETLHNAIDQGQLAHSYLFCGPRGVGKTTCARIFAKEINKASIEDENHDFSFNIFELDAASNNSVDDIRYLNEQVRIPPQVGEYKVYIIDEVHMLSKAAFNAFLKTLEEPPKHAKFILATTEKHKIIPTILSRCQIYDFSRIGVEEISEHLKGIATKEDIQFEEEALHVIGQKADGALRDALSIFDQLSSFTNRNLSYKAVLKNLHVLDYDYFFAITKALYEKAYADALVTLDEILRLGFDGGHFLEGLESHMRDLLVCKAPGTLKLLEVAESVKARYQEQAELISADWLIEALKIAGKAETSFKASLNQRLSLEVLLLNLASLGEKKNASSSEKPSIKEPEKPKSRAYETPKVASSGVQNPEQPAVNKPLTAQAPVEKPKAPPTEQNKTTPEQTGNRRRTRRASTISLNINDSPDSINKEEEDDQPTGVEMAKESQKLDLSAAWNQMCEKAVADGYNNLNAILKRQNINEGSAVIKIQLNHEIEAQEFNHHKADVLTGLRHLTGNPELSFEVSIVEMKSEVKLFTTKDKFEELSKANPELKNFKKNLDLDFL